VILGVRSNAPKNGCAGRPFGFCKRKGHSVMHDPHAVIVQELNERTATDILR